MYKMDQISLPIDQIRDSFEGHLGSVPIVLSAPTGSGKSTQVPRWCAEVAIKNKDPRPVLVIEPRRVACRSLAMRVAQLEGGALGGRVGYTVRDEDRSGPQTQIRFVTSGVGLRLWADDHFASFSVIIIDEFHERSLDVDLLLALCIFDPQCALVVMSATFEAARLAEHLQGVYLKGEGRLYEVTHHYRSGTHTEPSDRDLPQRVAQVTREVCEETEGDLLVFLPGKREIYACQHEIERGWAQRSSSHDGSYTSTHPSPPKVYLLHGELSLDEQSLIFQTPQHQRVILSTNVAETSLTVPRITAVIDSGLVRQTRYYRGRGALALSAIAQDSAAQRAGRAGRLGPGRCYRLWSQGASLKPHTPPELHRGSLVSLLLAAAACGVRLSDLRFLDPPKEYAVEEARSVLIHLNAIDQEESITRCGRALFHLGVDIALGRWIVEAQREGNLEDLIDLVSALSARRTLFLNPPPRDLEDHLRAEGCDAYALIKAMRAPLDRWSRFRLNSAAMREAHQHRHRLARALAVETSSPSFKKSIDRRRLALTLLRADPRCAYVARSRRKQIAWCGVGADMKLGRESAPSLLMSEDPSTKMEALIVLESHAKGKNQRQNELLITAAMPIPLPWLKSAGLGEEQLQSAVIKRGKLIAEVHLIFAKKVLAKHEVTPEGPMARQAIVDCLLSKRLWPLILPQIKEGLFFLDIYTQLNDPQGYDPERFDLARWVLNRVEELGVEHGSDLELLSPEDLLPEPLPVGEKHLIEREFPPQLKMSDATYVMHYQVAKKSVIMEQIEGSRRRAPLVQWLPKCGGFQIKLKQGQHLSMVRPRRR